MSTRWYPIYQRGNPQLRVFLPNFWMKMVRPQTQQPSNVVQFACSMEMTMHDIKNYLEKIYNVKSAQVRTRIALGKTKRDPGQGYVIKEDDIKYAYVILPKSESFTFPDLFPEGEAAKSRKEEEKTLEEAKKNYKKFLDRNKERPSMPGWFTI